MPAHVVNERYSLPCLVSCGESSRRSHTGEQEVLRPLLIIIVFAAVQTFTFWDSLTQIHNTICLRKPSLRREMTDRVSMAQFEVIYMHCSLMTTPFTACNKPLSGLGTCGTLALANGLACCFSRIAGLLAQGAQTLRWRQDIAGGRAGPTRQREAARQLAQNARSPRRHDRRSACCQLQRARCAASSTAVQLQRVGIILPACMRRGGPVER